MSKRAIPQANVYRCENGQYQAECPGCGQFVDVDSVEHDLGLDERGVSLGHHTEPDPARFEAHYRSEH
jgi:hypothetical protein